MAAGALSRSCLSYSAGSSADSARDLLKPVTLWRQPSTGGGNPAATTIWDAPAPATPERRLTIFRVARPYRCSGSGSFPAMRDGWVRDSHRVMITAEPGQRWSYRQPVAGGLALAVPAH